MASREFSCVSKDVRFDVMVVNSDVEKSSLRSHSLKSMTVCSM